MADHARLGLSRRDTWTLSILIVVGVLVGGRGVEIAFDEWRFYREHPALVPAFWLGGMATHGLLIGAAAATGLYAVVKKKPFLALADTLVVPGAFLLGVGHSATDGLIVGSVTDVWWGVKFPYADGFRHPVVLYDGMKNLLLMAFLLQVRRTSPTPGAVAARFVFWYAFPRIFIDLFRDYPTHRLALGTGQTLNFCGDEPAIGVVLLVRSRLRRRGRLRRTAMSFSPASGPAAPPHWAQRVALSGLLAFCLTIPSNSGRRTSPVRYVVRHPGVTHSWWYPPIDWAPPAATPAPPVTGTQTR